MGRNLVWMEVPEGWKSDKAKYIFHQMNRPVRPEDDIITAFRDGTVTLRSNRRTEGFTNSLKEIGYQGVRRGDLVIHAMDGFAGAIGVSDSDGKSTPVYSVCQPIIPANNYYYAYLIRFLALNGYIESLARGIRERSTEFRFKEFRELELPIPPLDVQNAIVRFLDEKVSKINTLIANYQRLTQLLKEKRTSLISHTVTNGLNRSVDMKDSAVEWLGKIPKNWQVKKIKHALQINPETLPENTSPNYIIQYLDIANVNEINGTGANQEFLFSDAPSRARRIVRAGDTIISTVRTYLKAVAYFENPLNNQVVSTGFAVLRSRKNVYPKFLKWLVLSEEFIERVVAHSVGVGYPAINPSELSNLPIWLPPYSEQYDISNFLDRETIPIDSVLLKIQGIINRLQEYRTSIISSAVTGKFM